MSKTTRLTPNAVRKLIANKRQSLRKLGLISGNQDCFNCCNCCGGGTHIGYKDKDTPPSQPTNCGFCCGDSARAFVTVTVSGVTGTECCGSWNSTWELALVAIPNTPPDPDTCYWELLGGCGVDPRIDLSIGTCFSGLQLLSIRFAADRTTVPYQSAQFTHLGFGALDCTTFWDTAWAFSYSGNNNGCDFTGATVSVAFHN